MPARSAVARKAALLGSAVEKASPNSSGITADSHHDGVQTPANDVKSKRGKAKGAKLNNPRNRDSKIALETSEDQDMIDEVEDINAVPVKDTGDVVSTQKVRGKRKRVTLSDKKDGIVDNEPVKGGWDELPHGMGRIGDAVAMDNGEFNNDSEVIDAPPNKRARKTAASNTEEITRASSATGSIAIKLEGAEDKKPPKKRAPRGKAKTPQPVTPESSEDVEPITNGLRKEFREELNKGIDPITEELKEEFKEESIKGVKTAQLAEEKPKKKRAPRAKKLDTSSDVKEKVDELLDAASAPIKVKKEKANPYGLTPGKTPFPDFVMPTPEACKAVEDALSEFHGKVEVPKEIPAPSLEVTGCGEVPSVLDALIRTRLSASTTAQNAKYAFQGLVERYGLRKEGIGAGSVDWNKVRESDVLDIEKAIKRGGLAKTKSVSIKKILEMVHELNITRHDAFIKEKEDGVIPLIVGADRLARGQKDMEIEIANQGVLSLDFMHGLTPDEAMNEFVKFPGIGVKTASCVLLFCLQRPSFAVDTHVWRLCKWLKWVPEGATRDQTFSHCEVRVPNEMKYSLHQLFIRHGKTCGRCRAITGESSEVWETTVCPIEHLVERTGKKKRGPPPKKSAAREKAATMRKRKGKQIEESEEDEAEMSELSDLSDLGEQRFDNNEAESSDDDVVSSSDEE